MVLARGWTRDWSQIMDKKKNLSKCAKSLKYEKKNVSKQFVFRTYVQLHEYFVWFSLYVHEQIMKLKFFNILEVDFF